MDRRDYRLAGEYGYDPRGGVTMFKDFLGILLALVLIGVLLGITFSRIEILNPSLTAERVRRLSAERAVAEARTYYEQQRWQLDLERRQALTELELRWRKRWAKTGETAVSLLVLALAFAIVVIGLGGAVYLTCLGIVRLREAATAPQRGQVSRHAVSPLLKAVTHATRGVTADENAAPGIEAVRSLL